jgi:hypothetical protein
MGTIPNFITAFSLLGLVSLVYKGVERLSIAGKNVQINPAADPGHPAPGTVLPEGPAVAEDAARCHKHLPDPYPLKCEPL